MASPLNAPAVKRYATTQTPPNSPRNAPRVGVLTLFSIIGLYALGFVVWGVSLSGSFVSSSSQLIRQLRRRQGAENVNKKDGIAVDRRWMAQLLDADRPPDLRCIGWKQTDSCDLQATEVPTRNRGCDQFVRGGIGGYCLMKDEATGQQIQWEVAKLAATIEREKETARNEDSSIPANRSEGILMVIYPKLLSEMDIGNGTSLLDDIPKKLQEEYGPLTLHPITNHFRYRAPSPHAPEVEAAFEASKPMLPPNKKIDSPRVPLGSLGMPYSLLREKYSVHIFNGAPEFDETQWCYGQSVLTAPRYTTIAWGDTAFPDVERNLLQYANEAVALLPKPAVEYIVQTDREEAS
ncbi:hypothetical protein PC121_g12725 [Phytophthora cactorum]|nr:hypothetical protein PC121_g12725 [Phytophthora cactorum]